LNHKTNHIPNPTTLKKSSNKFGEKAEKTREEISMMCSWLAQKNHKTNLGFDGASCRIHGLNRAPGWFFVPLDLPTPPNE
ncbi:hypothetical protein BAE44_0016829, partial [Dichanthelium oligosanthes]